MGRRGDCNEEGSRTEADPLGSGVRSFSFTPSSPQITKHVADILARQDFILKLATAMMKFGAPSHRVDAQMQATARALDLTCQMVYLPGLMLISFGDPATHTSDTKFLKQENGLELSKLLSAHMLYWNVVHDRMAVGEASVLLEVLLNSKPTYSFWRSILIGGLCSAFIQPSAFAGSFIDCLVSIPLGMLLVVVQVGIVKMNGYLLLFEIVITMVNAFLAAALAATGHFCFASVASGSVVLVLPGYLFLAGSLELGNRAVVSGSTRLVFAIIYSLMLGFGLSIGSEVYIRVTGTSIRGSSDYTCSALRLDAPWYRATVSPYFYFLTIPAYTLSLAARNGQPLEELTRLPSCLFSSTGFSANYFSGRVFTGRPDITSTFGSFVVGVLGGIYGRFTRGSAFVVIVPGILLQLPSGMLQGGLLRQASDSTTQGRNSFASGYSVATQLISVSIGLS
ncbi:DUF1212-domain-containing protein [Mrakia frigida]|uniref:threonine/serine exporter family protein n=1 Tax=Mrakia frigida TaxID=29902 RepID=UPI003FCBF14D